MNNVVADILRHFGSGYLMHYGMPRRSGRYPWGSGDTPYQHSSDFIARVDGMRKQGLTQKEIARELNLSTGELRTYMDIAKDQRDMDRVATAKRLMEKEGKSRSEAARVIGINESTLRNLENRVENGKVNSAKPTMDILKDQIEKHGFLDVGDGTEKALGISKELLNKAITVMEVEDGYKVYDMSFNQLTNAAGQKTTMRVLCRPGTEYGDVFHNDIHFIGEANIKSRDGGATFKPAIRYPENFDSKRLSICYAEDGGSEKDGVIELRRGVPDLSMGESTYSQARILVDNSMYLKGMAIYSDDLPEGVDIRFNTNKKRGTPIEKVLKPIENDPLNPFGATIKDQVTYIGEDGKEHLSVVNKKEVEGGWGDWSDRLPSQFLSKQPLKLIKQQLDLAEKEKLQEYEEIKALDNPTIRKYYLNDFAGKCDSAAADLSAAALPRQKYQVILPLKEIKDNEVFAPNFNDGETVALIRYPHGGTFEIPIVKVNNKNSEGQRVIGMNAMDAVGINSNVAARLSGADFDGDFVMVIPCNSPTSDVRIVATESLKALEGFDPKYEYGPDTYEGRTVRLMKKSEVQKEMGMISNLITDMTLKGCRDPEELGRAVKHSMVVIDAYKHKLDYKRSEQENGIKELKDIWQATVDPVTGRTHYGASTLISKAKSPVYVDVKRGNDKINKETGELYNDNEVKLKRDYKTGEMKVAKKEVTMMSTVKDANELSSGTPQETAYANYANSMKSLANRARLDIVNTPRLKYDAVAAQKYSKEVDSLKAKLNESKKLQPLQRQAMLIANRNFREKISENPDLKGNKKEYKKAKQRSVEYARVQTGYRRSDANIDITENEWNAIQSGAISDNMLTELLRYADRDKLREWSMPKESKNVSTAQQNRIKALVSSGYTNSDIAEALNLPLSTVQYYIQENRSSNDAN